MTTRLVSVIIVSYNTRVLTSKCLKAVYDSAGIKEQDLEVIVVDNNSTDDTVKYLKEHYPKVKLIVNSQNLGFGGANNQGLAQASGKYTLLLNTDAFLEPITLSTLINILENNSNICSVGPRFTYQDGSIQQSAGYFPTPWRIIGWMWGLDKLPVIKLLFPTPYHVYDSSWYEEDRQVDWLMGACVLIRADQFKKIGGFDEKIFMYAEEIELYLRLKEHLGKTNHFTNDTSIVHLGSASTKKANASRLVYELRGIEYIYAKHYPNLLWFIRFIIYTGVMLRIAIYSAVPSRRSSAVEYKKFFNKNI